MHYLQYTLCYNHQYATVKNLMSLSMQGTHICAGLGCLWFCCCSTATAAELLLPKMPLPPPLLSSPPLVAVALALSCLPLLPPLLPNTLALPLLLLPAAALIDLALLLRPSSACVAESNRCSAAGFLLRKGSAAVAESCLCKAGPVPVAGALALLEPVLSELMSAAELALLTSLPGPLAKDTYVQQIVTCKHSSGARSSLVSQSDLKWTEQCLRDTSQYEHIHIYCSTSHGGCSTSMTQAACIAHAQFHAHE
jgi:hypothetical protein